MSRANPRYTDEQGRFDFDKYFSHWRKAHPEKQEQYAIRSAIHKLTKHGYTVTPPTVSEEGGEEE